MTKSLATLIVGFFAAAGGVWWVVLSQQTSPTRNTARVNSASHNTLNTNTLFLSSTSVLDEFHQPHLTPVQTSTLLADLQDESKYAVTTDYSLNRNCGTSATADILKNLDAQRKVQIVNGTYAIVRTPNLQSWDIATAMTFMDDPNVVCGVGFFFPFEVTADHILWRQGCSSGALFTDSKGNLDLDVVQCFQAQEAISRHYGLAD